MVEEVKHHITLTYLNIRQSIAILLAKIILVDILMAGVIIGAYLILITGGNLTQYNALNIPLFLSVFVILSIIKILATSYVILLWLNEYYEITPNYIYHKSGVIFKKTEEYRLDHVRSIDVADSLLGEIFNFATISLYDIRLNKYLDMYLIHNARRYAKVLKELRPNLEMKQDKIKLPFLPKELEEESPDY